MHSRRPGIIVTILFGIVAIVASAAVALVDGPTTSAPRSHRLERPNTTPRAAVLVLGTVSSHPAEELEIFQPFVDHLASRLDAHGIRQGRVLVAASIREMAERMAGGEVDLYIDSPMPVAAVVRDAHARAVAIRWKKGVRDYRSEIVVLATSAIEQPEDLRGHTIAFSERFSTSAHLVPRARLIRLHGLTVVAESDDRSPLADAIRYVFSGDDETSLVWLLRGRVDAAALSDRDLEEIVGRDVGLLRTIDLSAPIPRHVVCVRSGLDHDLSLTLQHVLMSLHEDDAGRSALWRFENTTRFESLPAEAFRMIEQLHWSVAEQLHR